jgi:hypothetical protein
MKTGSLLLIGGGAAALVAGLFVAKKKSDDTADAIKKDLGAPPVIPAAPTSTPAAASVAITNPKYPTFAGRVTGYWPFQEGLSATERKMEGAPVDRKGAPLHTIEDFLSGKSDHVSVSGDYTIFPYGQKILIPWGPTTLTGRITDTGSHFHGILKVFRLPGTEPLDLCVASSKTPIVNRTPTVSIVPGDNFEQGRAVATNKFQNQTVVTGMDRAKIAAAEAILGAYYAALETALEKGL